MTPVETFTSCIVFDLNRKISVGRVRSVQNFKTIRLATAL